MDVIQDAPRRDHAGFEPPKNEVVDSIAGKFLEGADVEQVSSHLSHAQCRHKSSPPVVLPKYGKPPHGELFAAVELEQSRHS